MTFEIRYIIKATYCTGPHKGESYFLRKAGYVTDEYEHQWDYTTYKSEAIANRVCAQYEESNALDYRLERKRNEQRIKEGKPGKDWFIYELETYEPYAVRVYSSY